MHALIVANRDHLRPWMPWADQEQDGTATFTTNAVADAATDRALQLAVIVDGSIVGSAGFNVIDWSNRATQIGYWLSAAAQGNGLITRTVSTMVDHGFGEWRLHRIELRAAPANARSRALAERLGFT